MEEPPGDAIMEEREETMVSPRGGGPFLRAAHFLKPTIINTPPPPALSKAQIFDFRDTPLQVTFKGRQSPIKRWKNWVNLLLPRYQNIWKSAGIYESILISTYKIQKEDDLVIALAERWCLDTNTFVFPWGESTVTLEDIVVLGGYSVSGYSVCSPLSSNKMRETEENLIEAHRNIGLNMGKKTGIHVWMDHFMNKSGQLEHEAFLALWLSWFVFPRTHPRVGRFVFPIAVRLSEGTRLALAPAVLASIYRDLSLLKKAILSWLKGESFGRNRVKITLFAPLQFVQAWAWERFPALRPSPISIRVGQPRIARWHKAKKLEVGDLKIALDSAGECFQWRPYCTFVDNWKFNKCYREKEEWIMVEPGIDEEIKTYAMYLRCSELVGLGCEEQYLPHRVAMQFGLDQDIPAFVPRSNYSHESAWSNYTRSIGDKKLYVRARLNESSVTVRYSTWWGRAMSAKVDNIKSFVRKPRSKTRKKALRSCWGLHYKSDEKVDPLTADENVDNSKTHSAMVNNVENKNSTSGVEDPLTVDENVNSSKIHSAMISNIENKNSTSGDVDMPGSDLEPRISRLEMLVAMLKAEKIGWGV